MKKLFLTSHQNNVVKYYQTSQLFIKENNAVHFWRQGNTYTVGVQPIFNKHQENTKYPKLNLRLTLISKGTSKVQNINKTLQLWAVRHKVWKLLTWLSKTVADHSDTHTCWLYFENSLHKKKNKLKKYFNCSKGAGKWRRAFAPVDNVQLLLRARGWLADRSNRYFNNALEN